MRKFYFIAFLILLFGCTTEVDYPLDSRNPKWLVVDGWVTNIPGAHDIVLSETREYSDTLSENAVENATVRIFDELGFEILTEVEPGRYRTSPNYALEPGKDYTYEVTSNGVTHLYQSQLEDQLEVELLDGNIFQDTVYIELVVKRSELGTAYLVFNLYNGIVEGNDTLWTPVFTRLGESEIAIVDFVNDEIEFVDVDFALSAATLTNLVRLEVHVFNEPLFEYFSTLRQEEIGTLFSPYPSNPDFQFSNGAFGVVFNSAVTNVVLELE